MVRHGGHFAVFVVVTALFSFAMLHSTHGTEQTTLTGKVRVIDGDSLAMGDHRIRLEGFDSPELKQICYTNSEEPWKCGVDARDFLHSFIGGRDVRCVASDVDRYGRLIAACSVGGVDIGATMVRAGLALAYRQYSMRYVDLENAARADREGVWAGLFVEPWTWRRSGNDSLTEAGTEIDQSDTP